MPTSKAIAKTPKAKAPRTPPPSEVEQEEVQAFLSAYNKIRHVSLPRSVIVGGRMTRMPTEIMDVMISCPSTYNSHKWALDATFTKPKGQVGVIRANAFRSNLIFPDNSICIPFWSGEGLLDSMLKRWVVCRMGCIPCTVASHSRRHHLVHSTSAPHFKSSRIKDANKT